MRKLLLSIPILLLSLPLPLSAQNRVCPPQGYYGAMSNVCPPSSRKTSAPLTAHEKNLYFTKKQQEQDRQEQLARFRIQQALPCVPRWMERNELNVQYPSCQ